MTLKIGTPETILITQVLTELNPALSPELHNMPLEIGSRGLITARNHMVLATICGMVGSKNVKTFRRTLGKIALVAFHRIYLARRSS